MSGDLWALWGRNVAPGGGGSKNMDYMLNRTTDGGMMWSLNGNAFGIVVTNADSTQPQPKFGTVNALLGGVHHAAVDANTGDLYYVYGNRDAGTGNDRLAIRRVFSNGMGGVTIGPESFVTGQVEAALPVVAVNQSGTVAVFYYTFDGFSGGLPVFTAHLALSDDQGASFTDLSLLTFLSSATDNGDPRQRVLGDYMQMQAVGDDFYGSFTANGVPFGRPFANHDPIFFTTANLAPVAMCRPFSDFADAECCITVDVSDIDDGSFDPNGEDDIDTLCITEVDGIPVGCEESVVVCDEGAHVVTLTITDLAGKSDSCDALVTIFDITPPDLECPDDMTVTCGEPTDPSETGMAAADDNCDLDPLIEFDDVVITSTCPADPVDFVIERTWTATDESGNFDDCLQTITVLKVVLPLDIKPGSCPNSYNRNSHGVLPLGLLGSDDFDVSTIDISTILISRADCIGGSVAPIMGPPGPHPVLADVGTPFKGDPCDCHEREGDGIIDWSLKFSTPELVEALELDTLPAGSMVELVVSGQLDDGCRFIATDCVRLVRP